VLRITKTEEQAIRLTMQLAQVGHQLTLSELAARESLPEPTVAKLLGQLRRGGVVAAARGRLGGYALATAPDRISTAQVLRAVGSEPAQQHACVSDPTTMAGCPRIEDCGLRSVWRHLYDQVTYLLEGTSVADLLQLEASVDAHVQNLWPAVPAEPLAAGCEQGVHDDR
jgi:Rrf2 family protein